MRVFPKAEKIKYAYLKNVFNVIWSFKTVGTSLFIFVFMAVDAAIKRLLLQSFAFCI